MEVGIVGLPLVGKTALFKALVGPSAVIHVGKPNLGVALVPDPRLELINRYIETRKLTTATVQLVDLPGLDVGQGGKQSGALLASTRTVDALCHVVRCFETPDAPGPRAGDPLADIAVLEDELLLADLVVAESARDRAARASRSGDAETKMRCAILDRVLAVLNEGLPARTITDWTDAEDVLVKGYGLLTGKRTLYVANVAEDDLAGDSATARQVAAHAEKVGGESVAVCAKLEAELAELNDEDRAEMLEGLGLIEPAIGPLARALNRLLGLVVFYTAGPKEIRAWAAPDAATAPEAAGVVHTDMQRGFIRAECYHFDDLEQYKSEKAIRAAGKLRSEGKHYHVHDGDVLHFLFNV